MPDIGEIMMLDCGTCAKKTSHVFTIKEMKKIKRYIRSEPSGLEFLADLVFAKVTKRRVFRSESDLVYGLGWQCTNCGNLILVLEADAELLT